MQAWDTRAGNMIVPTLNFLSEDFLKETSREQVRACEMLKGYMDLGRTLPEPPAADVAEAFTAWIDSIEDVVAVCVDGPGSLSEAEYLDSVFDRLRLSDAVFATYVTVLADYVPLREGEATPPEPAPLPSPQP